MALLPGSPAIDAGSSSIAGFTIPTADQRGAVRGSAGLKAGSTDDIGAYEASSSYVVTGTADSSDIGTLRAAVGWANLSTNSNPANLASPAANMIDFNIPGIGVQTISLLSALPSITVPVDIEGTSQPGYTDTPLIDLDGTSAGVGTSGLDFEAGSGGSEVVGLVINNFNQDGILFASAGNTVQSSYIGTNAAGTAAGSQPMTYGVVVTAANNTIGGLTATPGTGPGNVISGSSNSGVAISGTSSTGNLVEGNLVGTNASGTSAVPNTDYGVVVLGAPTGNTIGGTAAGSRNVVSGNGIVGVLLTGTGTSGNLVEGNYIGTTAAGTAALGNADYGVLINDGADDNWVGVNSVDGPENGGQGNIIAGNGLYGVNLDGSGTSGNVIAGNLIGLNVDSHGHVIDGLGDGFAGVILTDGASGNWIGVNSAAGVGTENTLERNVISGSYIGVAIYDTGTTGNVVAGNLIGTDPSGTTAVPNQTFDAPLSWGVVIAVGASSNLIGTSGQDGANDALERNVISGNTEVGVYIYEFYGTQGAADHGKCRRRRLHRHDRGAGTAALGNVNGVIIAIGAADNWVGVNPVYGPENAGQGNVISGNSNQGVWIESAGTTGNVVAGNDIGTTAVGTAALANGVDGVLINSGASADTIGGTVAGARNIISGNGTHGVEIDNPATDNLVEGNYIGTDITGTVALGNGVSGGSAGVYVSGASNTIGGTVAGAGNVIAGSGSYGIRLTTSTATGNLVEGNEIGTNAAGIPRPSPTPTTGSTSMEVPPPTRSAERPPVPATSSRATRATASRSPERARSTTWSSATRSAPTPRTLERSPTPALPGS